MEYTILEYINKSSISKYFFIFYIIVMHIIFSSFNFQNNHLTKVKYFEFMILHYILFFFTSKGHSITLYTYSRM